MAEELALKLHKHSRPCFRRGTYGKSLRINFNA